MKGMGLAMNEPQIWTVIGVFAATVIGLVTLITQVFMRQMTVQFTALRNELGGKIDRTSETLDGKISSLRSEMVLRFEQVDRGFEQVDRRFEQVDRRFEQVDQRLDRLEDRVQNLEKKVDDIDRDVQGIARRVFPE